MFGSASASRISRPLATGAGLSAILLWALLALFTVYTGQIPPFQLTAMTFFVAFCLALAKWLVKGDNIGALFRLPGRLWMLGVGGLFGYHFFYFMALKNAPAAEAGLIAYLWPLLIVLFSTLLPNERLRSFHVLGALLSLIGAGVLVTKGQGVAFDSRYGLGYGAALVCAFIWSGYSVLSRRFSHVSTDVIGIFCGVTSVLALICHLAFEQTLWPSGLVEWLAVLGLGIGPVGAAFFLWDVGVKHGDIQGLGVLSYLSPLLSTLLLVGMGAAVFSWSLVAGCLLITLGAAVGSLNIFRELVGKRS
ncbi:aromatic amino acid exporter YddG [Sneathiella chinensis]|uniref:Membrane protein n=1 Tax=Sneathiella chinensis TaxID=349750 RepID=A0ABQ5TZJ1_9PROT|nr:DMT family transporter [Sneathiella chinensis]GLQ05299.1 membrane protein [Sneathiella chinensis]